VTFVAFDVVLPSSSLPVYATPSADAYRDGVEEDLAVK
jgi:hypothetical protein